MRIHWIVALLICSVALPASAQSLSVGSAAPPIDIEHWMNGREPIRGFEPGKVYVIEFWSTGCGPCIAGIPHLKEVQERHQNDVSVISVSHEEREDIEKFLELKAGDLSYGEITSAFWLAADPDGSAWKDYMRASGQSGIPASFIVGKTGKIEWIGHPSKIDDSLDKVVNETWDRDEFAKRQAEETEVKRKVVAAVELSKNGRHKEALAAIDRLLECSPEHDTARRIEALRRRIEAESKSNGQRTQASYTSYLKATLNGLNTGEHIIVPVTGSDRGPVWGSEVYTGDSSIETSAVHAGALKVGERGYIEITRVDPPENFKGGENNGVRTRPWGKFSTAFKVKRHIPTEVR
jgi:thiol-disulfide isomerase/thioredoxin